MFHLTPDEDTAVLKSVVHGIIEKIPVPFPLGDPDACKNSNITCPIQQGNTYSFAPVIYVEPNYPSVSITYFSGEDFLKFKILLMNEWPALFWTQLKLLLFAQLFQQLLIKCISDVLIFDTELKLGLFLLADYYVLS